MTSRLGFGARKFESDTLGFAEVIRSAGTICRATLPFYKGSTLATRIDGRPPVGSKKNLLGKGQSMLL